MENVFATCPICHATHEYGGELVGRYTFCRGCRARFYVEVPALGGPRADQPVARPKVAVPNTTLDDLLWDTQQGTRFVIESLVRQQADTRALRRLLAGALVLGLANFAGIVLLFVTRTQ